MQGLQGRRGHETSQVGDPLATRSRLRLRSRVPTRHGRIHLSGPVNRRTRLAICSLRTCQSSLYLSGPGRGCWASSAVPESREKLRWTRRRRGTSLNRTTTGLASWTHARSSSTAAWFSWIGTTADDDDGGGASTTRAGSLQWQFLRWSFFRCGKPERRRGGRRRNPASTSAGPPGREW